MRFSAGFVVLAMVLVAAAMVGAHLGWVTARGLFDVGMGVVGLGGLALVLKWPWDLAFEARALVVDQDESRKRSLRVDGDEQGYARRTARRLVVVCVLLHLVTAAVIGAATWLSQGRVGYYFAGFYFISTFFRPMGAAYQQIRRRLVELRGRARYPREDAFALQARVESLGGHVTSLTTEHQRLRQELAAASERAREAERELRGRLTETAAEVHSQAAAYSEKVDAVCREFSRNLERLTEDKDLVTGMRAFVRMVKTTA